MGVALDLRVPVLGGRDSTHSYFTVLCDVLKSSTHVRVKVVALEHNITVTAFMIAVF